MRRLRVLHVGPLPPTPSGIADYAAELLPSLAERVDVTLCVADDAPPPWPAPPHPAPPRGHPAPGTRHPHPGTWNHDPGTGNPEPETGNPEPETGNQEPETGNPEPETGNPEPGTRNPEPAAPHPVLHRAEVRGRADVDLALYQLGNHRLHAWQLGLMAQMPGVTVLHDAVLHHLYADALLARGRGAAYLREVGYARAEAVSRAVEAVAGASAPAWYEEPLIERVLDLSRATIVHSRYAAAAVLRARPTARVRRIHHGVAPPRLAGPPAEAPFTVGTFGGLDVQKRIPTLLRAFEALRRDRPDARLLLVGAPSPAVAIPELPGVELAGRVTLEEMERLMARCHVCVQLRWPTAGEASGAALRALRLGRPLVVSDRGWFAELPSSVARRIPAGVAEAAEADALAAALRELADDRAAREQMSAAALELADAWSWSRAAALYAEVLEEVAGELDRPRSGTWVAAL